MSNCCCKTDGNGYNSSYTEEQLLKFKLGQFLNHVCNYNVLCTMYGSKTKTTEYHCCICNNRKTETTNINEG